MDTKKEYLVNQFYTYSMDTDCFYTDKESELNEFRFKLFGYSRAFDLIINRNEKLIKLIIELVEYIDMKPVADKGKVGLKEKLKEIDKKSNEYRIVKQQYQDFRKLCRKIDYNIAKIPDRIEKQDELVQKAMKDYTRFFLNVLSIEGAIEVAEKKKKQIKRITDKLNKRIEKEIAKFEGIRTLRKESLIDSNKISQFESTLSRTLGIETNSTTSEIMIVRAFRHSIFDSLMLNGFKDSEGNLFQYFTSSAGGIRNSKSVWMKVDTYNDNIEKLLCGLTIKKINDKGGMNLNKFNAYQSLCLTASTPWKDFSIDQCIVVDDFETTIYKEADVIDKTTYEVVRKKNEPLVIPHMDGAGICLPSVSDKSFQFRLPGFKGLLIPFLIDEYLDTYHKDETVIIKDIYGKEYDIKKEIKEGKISIIFTKSQFKLWKMFKIEDKEDKEKVKKSWQVYKSNFKHYGCEAVKCKVEEDIEDGFQDKKISYQVLQTLYKMERKDLVALAERTNSDIDKIGKDLKTTLSVLGVTDTNKKKDNFQQALYMYPELLADQYGKKVMSELRQSYIKDSKGGKLLIPGTKRTYIAPDVYAFCQWLFGKQAKPKGLLKDGEVSCKLFEDNQELDLLRSPHNYLEHAVRTNRVNKEINKWFITNDVHSSVLDEISSVLMFDVDGDDSLIVSNKRWVQIAKEHTKNIRPLKYELGVAEAGDISNPNMLEKLKAAYSKNIGTLAFSIAKVWNQPNFGEKERKIVAQLTFESNACIDFAKTLWYPTRPPEVHKQINEITKQKLPQFFMYAKDKEEKQVIPVNKKGFVSVVNMLDEIIISDNADYSKIEAELTLDYKKLMKNPKVDLETDSAKSITEVYDKENKSKFRTLQQQLKKTEKKGNTTKLGIYDEIKNRILQVDEDIEYVTDVLIKYLYEGGNESKETLWESFGSQILINMKKNIQNLNSCKECGDTIAPKKSYCTDCAKKRRAISNKKADSKYKGKKKRENKVG